MLSAGSRSGRLTVALINLAAVIERAEEQLLPSVFFWISQSFNATPTQLGSITLCRALVQALTSPIAGAAGDALDRRIIVGVGCMIWSCSNLAIAASRQLVWAMAFAGINGLGLSLVVPCSQSLIADYSEESARGRAFGAMAFVGSVGGMLGGVFAINLSHFSPLGIQGWRVAFALMAALGMLTGTLVVALAVDPRAQQKALAAMDARHKAGAGTDGRMRLLLRSLQRSTKQIVADMRYMMLLPTFQVIILQGIVGSVPWQAMAFLTLFLQLLGFSDFSASMLMAVSAVASAIGSWLGGVVGDLAARRSPNSGRAYTAQFSVACGLPLAAMLFCWTPANGASDLPASGAALWPYVLLLSAMGLTITWTPAACNSPLFAEVVPVDMRSRIYAFDRGFEGGVAACAAPLVGAMASSFFGFDAQHGTSNDAELNHRNAVALGKSLLIWLEVPWILCLIFYSGLHWVYPRDRRRLQQQLKQSAGLPMLS